MNLRIADSAGLVAFLHRIIGESGKKVLSVPDADIVQVGDAFFFHRDDPITVGGPFPSVGALVRSEGVRRHPAPEHASPNDRTLEIFEWAGSFFLLDGAATDAPHQFDSLEAALNHRGGLT